MADLQQQIADAEKKFLSALRYEQRVPLDRNKIMNAVKFTDIAARRLWRLIEQYVNETRANSAPISDRTQAALDYLARAA
jgi:hypothetical protein